MVILTKVPTLSALKSAAVATMSPALRSHQYSTFHPPGILMQA